MTTQTDQRQAFEAALTRRIKRGEALDRAVYAAAEEAGVSLNEEKVKALLQALRVQEVKAHDPDYARKVAALDQAIRQRIRGGMSVKKAIDESQDATGVRLSEQARDSLIQWWEEALEQTRNMRVEVVSDKEFRDIQEQARCVPIQEGRHTGWLCCACMKEGQGTKNNDSRDACARCGHERCSTLQ